MSGVHMGSGVDWWIWDIGNGVLIGTGLGCVIDGGLTRISLSFTNYRRNRKEIALEINSLFARRRPRSSVVVPLFSETPSFVAKMSNTPLFLVPLSKANPAQGNHFPPVSASNCPPMGIRGLPITRPWMGMGIPIMGSPWACRDLAEASVVKESIDQAQHSLTVNTRMTRMIQELRESNSDLQIYVSSNISRVSQVK